MVVSKGKLKAKMLEYFREVERTGEPLIVTDHGRRVLEIRPLGQPVSAAAILAELRDRWGASETAVAIGGTELMEPEWREEDEADDSWWTAPTPPK